MDDRRKQLEWMNKWIKPINESSANHLSAILMGVVRQDVKRSAGNSGFIGNSSLAPHAASCIQCLVEDGGLELPEYHWLPFEPADWK